MNYQRKTLADGSNIGQPGPLPHEISGLSDADLADLSAAVGDAASQLGFAGQGFFPVSRTISALGFKQRLSGTERMAIRAAAAAGDAVIIDFLDLLDTPGSGMIELDHSDTVSGLAYLVAHNLLTAERAAQIRA